MEKEKKKKTPYQPWPFIMMKFLLSNNIDCLGHKSVREDARGGHWLVL